MNYYLQALKNYANFKGRARRSEYWYFVLFNAIVGGALFFVGSAIHLGFLGFLYPVFVFIPSFSVAVRRMHDSGKSGWFLFIPIYGFILLLTSGTTGDNKYGQDPKAV